jgi:KDO2-lipid IV(A) lauroyltransferase
VATVLLLPLLLPVWLLPWRAATALGRLYGAIVFAAWPRGRRIAMINLRRAFGPSLTRGRARADTFRVLQNLGASVAEAIQFARRHKNGEPGWEALFEVEDPELMQRLLADPRPKIFVTGHLGSWEVAALVLSLRAGPGGAAVARRVDNPFLDRLVKRVRLRQASQWIEKRGAVAAALERLRAGQSVALLLDENGGVRGPWVSFLGRPASTRKTAALLSLRTGAPLVVGAAVRRPGRPRFLFRLALVEPPTGGQPIPEDVLVSRGPAPVALGSLALEEPAGRERGDVRAARPRGRLRGAVESGP